MNEDVILSELDIEHGPAEWREKHGSPKKYSVGFIESSKALLVDLSEITPKDLNKPLLDDLGKIAEKTQSEGLYVAVQAAASALVRNMMVYGFEKITKEEARTYTSDSDILLLKMEVNQEDDFVDLS